MKRSELFFTAISLPLDYLALILAALAAYQIRYLPAVTTVRPVIFDLALDKYLILVFIAALIWILVFSVSGLYDIKEVRRQTDEIVKIFLASSASIAAVMAVMFFTRYLFESRFIILMIWFFSFTFVSIERIIIRNIQRSLYKKGIGIHRVVVLGNSSSSDDLIKEFTKMPRLGYKVVEHFENFDAVTKDTLTQLAKDDKFDEIILTDPSISREKTLEIIDFLTDFHLDFKYTADLLGAKLSNFEIKTYDGIPVVEVKRTRLDGWGRILKRAFDIILAVFFIIIFSPIMLITAIAIKLDSEGPILFKYQRVGQKGKPFSFVKFRSMVKDAHQYRFDKNFLANHTDLRAGSPMMKFVNDPRITRVGKVIRRWSIDELPQLFLVLAGHMSLVGPRPHEIEEVVKYNKYQRKVLTIKPGVTGMAQVSGRSDLNFDEEVRLDTYYIENWSIKIDLQILSKTPQAIIKKRNAE